MPSHVAVIINPSSGADNSEDQQARLAEIFHARAIKASIALARSGEEIVELARRAVRERADPVVASGGDGTINAVASVLVGTDGEVTVMGTPLHYRVRPGALRVIVPKPSPVTGDV